MPLVKHQIECPSCEHEGYVVSEQNVEPPSYCPQCGAGLNDQNPPDDKDDAE